MIVIDKLLLYLNIITNVCVIDNKIFKLNHLRSSIDSNNEMILINHYLWLEKVEESECWKMLEQFLSLDIRDELWPFSHVWDSSGGHRDIFNIGTMLNLTPATTKLVKMLKMSSSIINYHLIPPAPARHRAHSWEHRLNFEIVNILNISTLILWYSVDRS